MATLLFCDVFTHDLVNGYSFTKGFGLNILRLMSLGSDKSDSVFSCS